METIERDYAPFGVQFRYVYKALAHPEYDGYVEPFTLEERVMHVREAERRLGSSIPWIVDNMDDDFKRLAGGVNNAEFLIGPDGRVLARRAWSDADALRADLDRFVGSIDEPTTVDDLDLVVEPPPGGIATGIVPRVEVEGRMVALEIEPEFQEAKHPFFVKLRAEADAALLAEGAGTMYLGFHLDRLHRVHWNNLAPPIEVRLDLPEGVEASRTRLVGPKIEEHADADPREFLVDVAGASSDTWFELRVKYYACDDDNTFCFPVRQQYRVRVAENPTAGWHLERGRPEHLEKRRRATGG